MTDDMQGARGRRLVVVSGIPGSGKTSLALSLAPRLGLPVLDKDDILDGLFESQGPGDESWRRRLSRESDAKSSISVDTSDVIDADEVARKIEAAFERCLKRFV